MAALYDTIGQDYRCYRQPDPRIRDAIVHRLGDARTVVNIGAGTGSYEPSDRLVVAVEPSMVMIRQRTHDAAPAVQAGDIAQRCSPCRWRSPGSSSARLTFC